MASTVDTHKLRSAMAMRTYIHDPADATVLTKIAWEDLALFRHFMAQLTVIVGAVVSFKIYASAASDGSNPVEVKVHAAPAAADAKDDSLVLECSSEELAALGEDLRYVSVEVDMGTNTDQASVTYVRAEPRYAQANLTPNSRIDGVAA